MAGTRPRLGYLDPMLALLLALAAQAAPVTYTLDPGQGALMVVLRKDRAAVAQAFAHDHAIVATGWSGTVTWDPADLSTCAVEIAAPVAGLVADTDAARARAGLGRGPSPGQVEQVQANMWAAYQLDLARFPALGFTATGCTPTAEGALVRGTLRIRGVELPVEVAMQVQADATRFAAQGRLPLRATRLGFQPYSGVLGTVRVEDEMELHVDVAGAPR